MEADYTSFFLEGAHHRHDSFTAALQATARMFGRESDYEQILAYSTNGFAPVVHPPEGCKSTWMMHGRGQCIDLVADYLGLDAQERKYEDERPRPVLPPEEKRAFWRTPEGQKWNAEADGFLRKQVSSALISGNVVLVDGGWCHHYHLWGVIRKIAEDGRAIGTALDGPKENELDHWRRVWVVAPKQPSRTRADADRIMLGRALARIRGDAPPFLKDNAQQCIWGLEAMDLWIAQMRKPAFQEDDPGSSAFNARCCAAYSYDGANHTSSYLRRRIRGFPDAAREQLAAAAACYDRVAELLAPFAHSARAYEKLFSEKGLNVKHADDVLSKVKEELGKAAQELEATVKILVGNA